MLTVIDCHSVDLDAIAQGAVLDVGSRGFRFSDYFAKRGHRVIALDPGENESPPPGVEFLKLALTGRMGGFGKLVLTDDLEARYVVRPDADVDRPYLMVGCLTMPELMARVGVTEWDLMKLNAEGVEFDILDAMTAPIARQIVVSFHNHCGHAKRPEAEIDGLVARLSQWYRVVRHQWDERYGAGRNAWDTVLVRRA